MRPLALVAAAALLAGCPDPAPALADGGGSADRGLPPLDDAAASDAAGASDHDSGSAASPDAGAAAPPDAGPGVGADAGPAPADAGACLGADLLAALGKAHVLVGFADDDATRALAPWDLQYKYLSAGIPDGAGPCTSCLTACTQAGRSCSNASGCGWWGCWQWDQEPPGKYVGDFVAPAGAPKSGVVPMITYYEILQSSGAQEGAGEVAAANDLAFMRRYLADWRFVLQNVGAQRALLHLEPDFWGYCEHVSTDPSAIPAAVASANPTDCDGQANTIAGLARCMVAMARKYAPNARIGLHGSPWATKIAVLTNRNPSLDVVGEAQKLGAYLEALGAAGTDFVVVDASDRDAAWYQLVKGQDVWWDATNATLPNFRQAFTWAKALAERVGKPILWWQLPVGNMALGDTTQHYRDNRVDYFLAHPDEVAAAHGFGMAFGAGESAQTTPSTDGGNLVAKTQAYAAAGGQRLCP